MSANIDHSTPPTPFTAPARRRQLGWSGFLSALLLMLILATASHTQASPTDWLDHWRAQKPCWRGVHLWLDNDAVARELVTTLPA